MKGCWWSSEGGVRGEGMIGNSWFWNKVLESVDGVINIRALLGRDSWVFVERTTLSK